MKKESIALTEAVYYILLSLHQQMHGYGIMQNVEKMTSGRVRLAAGTLYGAINVLFERGWIRSCQEDKDSRKKEYVITEKGKEVARDELERLKELVRNGDNIIGGEI